MQTSLYFCTSFIIFWYKEMQYILWNSTDTSLLTPCVKLGSKLPNWELCMCVCVCMLLKLQFYPPSPTRSGVEVECGAPYVELWSRWSSITDYLDQFCRCYCVLLQKNNIFFRTFVAPQNVQNNKIVIFLT